MPRQVMNDCIIFCFVRKSLLSKVLKCIYCLWLWVCVVCRSQSHTNEAPCRKYSSGWRLCIKPPYCGATALHEVRHYFSIGFRLFIFIPSPPLSFTLFLFISKSFTVFDHFSFFFFLFSPKACLGLVLKMSLVRKLDMWQG